MNKNRDIGNNRHAVFKELKRILALEVEKTESRRQPSVSDILEMPLRKSIKMFRTEKNTFKGSNPFPGAKLLKLRLNSRFFILHVKL